MGWSVGQLTDRGKQRRSNEDALATLQGAAKFGAGARALGLYIVSDGMGGAAAGEVASQIVTGTLSRLLRERLFTPRADESADRAPDYPAEFMGGVQDTNRAVYEARLAMGNDMGATLVAALVVGDRAYIVNVGDSRAYLIATDRIERISHDHSVVQRLVDTRQLEPDDVYIHPLRNVLLRNMGDKPEAAADLFTLTVEPGQFILLCTDGLWEMVRDPEIQRIVIEAQAPQEACRQLIAAANRNGGADNITALLLRYD